MSDCRVCHRSLDDDVCESCRGSIDMWQRKIEDSMNQRKEE